VRPAGATRASTGRDRDVEGVVAEDDLPADHLIAEAGQLEVIDPQAIALPQPDDHLHPRLALVIRQTESGSPMSRADLQRVVRIQPEFVVMEGEK